MRTSWIATIAFVSTMSALPAVASAQFTETQKGTGVGVLLGAGTCLCRIPIQAGIGV
jgi:hypothetical protein